MIRLTREVRLSVDRDWAGHVEFDRPVTNSWGGWPSAVGIVPYLRLRATVVGMPEPLTGFLCNITTIDRLLRQHAIPYTAEALREHGWHMPAEHLLEHIWARVCRELPGGAPIVSLQLWPTPCLCYGIERETPGMVFVTQQFEFAASHRLYCKQFNDEQNRRIFGKCNNPSGHGHNYLLEVTVAGEPNEHSGVVIALPELEQIVTERVIERFDHQHLNLDTEEFRDLNPSIENIARVIWKLLNGHLTPARLHRVRVWETPKTYAEYSTD